MLNFVDSVSHQRFFCLETFEHSSLFQNKEPVWGALKRLKSYLDLSSLGTINCEIPFCVTLKNPGKISIGEGTIVEPGVYIQGPCIIGKNCQLRHNSYIRPYLVTGNDCVIGHGVEIKSTILLEGVRVSHFNYIGNSILGNRVNMGAFATCANSRLDKKSISVRIGKKKFYTGMDKLGAVVGDLSQIGCHVLLNPGLLLDKNTNIFLSSSISHSNVTPEVPAAFSLAH